MKSLLFFCTGITFSTIVISSYGQSIDFSRYPADKTMVVVNRTASVFKEGKITGIRLDEGLGAGILWLKENNFSRGTIEVDLRGRDLLQRSFVGIAFHGSDDATYDAIYFRPFNFQSTDSIRKIHAVQYISHPDFTWKKLRDERNGQFEKAVIPAPDPKGWFHAKIVVTDRDVVVYVDHSEVPSLKVTRLNDRTNGTLGLWVGDGSNGEFANLTIRTE